MPARARPDVAHGADAPDAGDEPDGVEEPVAPVPVSASAEASGLGNRPLR